TIGRDEGILFYSDGLVEAHNKRGEMFGTYRLKDLLTKEAQKENGQRESSFTDVLLDELSNFTGHDWEQEDDITLLTLYRTPMENTEYKEIGEIGEIGGQPEQLEQLLEC